MKGFVGFCWGITALAAAVSTLILIGTFVGTVSAPQEAAGAALAVAIVAIPYIFTRSLQGLEDLSKADTIIDRLDTQIRLQAAVANNQPDEDTEDPPTEPE